MLRSTLALAALAVVPATAASAQEFASQYTSTAVKQCKLIDRAPKDEGNWSIWLCPGIAGYVVRLTEDDLRMTISVGRNLKEAEDAPVAKHQFPSFNMVGDTLEWRTFRGKPFAVIHRRTLADTSGPKPVNYGLLIVTRLNPTCHAAYIDVRANAPANANELARKAADQHGSIFDCNNDPIVFGKRGRAIALTRP